MAQRTTPARSATMSTQRPTFTVVTKPRRAWRWLSLAAVAAAGIAGAWLLAQPPARRSVVQTGRVVNTYPHDERAWSQGLTVDAEDGTLLEGTGVYRQSSLRRVDLETGRVLAQVDLDDRFFGEGVTVLGDRIYQLTWRERTGLIYDRKTLRELGRFRLDGEGWGLTTDGVNLIVSDGSSTLVALDPKTFAVVKRIPVSDGGRAVSQLNELEYVEGEIWANVWHQDYIVRINPETGRVTGAIDLAHLYPRRQRPHREHVLNGIAYDAKNRRLFVTGKNWPKLFEIELVDAR